MFAVISVCSCLIGNNISPGRFPETSKTRIEFQQFVSGDHKCLSASGKHVGGRRIQHKEVSFFSPGGKARIILIK